MTSLLRTWNNEYLPILLWDLVFWSLIVITLSLIYVSRENFKAYWYFLYDTSGLDKAYYVPVVFFAEHTEKYLGLFVIWVIGFICNFVVTLG